MLTSFPGPLPTSADDDTPSGIGLRRATPRDAPALRAVFDASVRDAWTFLGERTACSMFPPSHRDELVERSAPPNALLVAEDAGRIVGFVAVRREEGELFPLFVDPARARSVYAAAGYVPDGTVRESVFDGAELRELRLLKRL